ncbi:MAG: hypothetical protein P8J87_03035 [Verrucomicrobiales bacterium]|nr:hypothetical protein [Verrucomicrobiales bacterium]
MNGTLLAALEFFPIPVITHVHELAFWISPSPLSPLSDPFNAALKRPTSKANS